MTRINCGIKPSTLIDKHLLAEHREIKRIPNVVKSGKARLDNIPTTFCLGTGHVKFFYNKLGYLKKRYKGIHRECIKRGFNVQDYTTAWNDVPDSLMGNYKPTAVDRGIVMERLISKDKSYGRV